MAHVCGHLSGTSHSELNAEATALISPHFEVGNGGSRHTVCHMDTVCVHHWYSYQSTTHWT